MKTPKILREIKVRLLRLFGKVSPIDYINGSDTLPPPLKGEEEKRVFDMLTTNPKKAREILITHNLRLGVYIS